MAFWKKLLKKAIPGLLVLALCLPLLPVTTAAEEGTQTDLTRINPNQKGSITVTKYASNAGTGSFATGKQGQTIPEGYRTLQGAEFVLVQIYDAAAVTRHYNGSEYGEGEAPALNPQLLVKEGDEWKYNGGNVLRVHKGTTDENGIIAFTGLPVGFYVLKEITAPGHITGTKAEDALISIPMVNTADDTTGEKSDNTGDAENSAWMYNVYVYPKNKASASVTLTVVQRDGQTPLAETVFNLYKKQEDGSWALVELTAGVADIVTGADGTITLHNLAAGSLDGTQYKLVERAAPNGYIINRNPLFFTVNADNTITWNKAENLNKDVTLQQEHLGESNTVITFDNAFSMVLRKAQPELSMQVLNNAGSQWVQDDQYRMDDTLRYRITAYVPHNVAELENYEIQNIPGLGITDSIGADGFTVKYGDTAEACNTLLTRDQHYQVETVAASDTSGQGFMLTLKDNTAAGKFIRIEYSAHMNANAVIAQTVDAAAGAEGGTTTPSVTQGNKSTAVLTYSHYIGDTDKSVYTISDETVVYTYQFRITKYKDSAAEGNQAGGVQFNLYDQNGIVSVVKVSDGVYRLALPDDADSVKTTVLETGSGTASGATGTAGTTQTAATKGMLLIQGLENGSYSLKETKTIEGYNLLSTPFSFTVNVAQRTSWQDDTGYGDTERKVREHTATTYTPEDPTGTADIINKKGFTLPKTGSMGYLLFCTVGIVLIGGGAMLLFGGRKKKIR